MLGILRTCSDRSTDESTLINVFVERNSMCPVTRSYACASTFVKAPAAADLKYQMGRKLVEVWVAGARLTSMMSETVMFRATKFMMKAKG